MADRLSVTTDSWRPQRRAGLIDPQIRRMALIAGGAVVVAGLGFGGYSMLAHRPHGVPVIEADSRPLRVKPDNPGGMQVVGAEEQIMGGTGTTSQADAMAPAPEVPEPQVLRAQIQAARPPAPPAPVPTVQPAAPAAPPPIVAAAPPVIAAALPQPRAAVPPAGTPTRPAASAGGMEVQLAAVESEQAAVTEWQHLSKRMPDLLASHRPTVVKAERDGKTFYRLRTGGFADTAQATAFCTQVKAKGGGCAIASF